MTDINDDLPFYLRGSKMITTEADKALVAAQEEHNAFILSAAKQFGVGTAADIADAMWDWRDDAVKHASDNLIYEEERDNEVGDWRDEAMADAKWLDNAGKIRGAIEAANKAPAKTGQMDRTALRNLATSAYKIIEDRGTASQLLEASAVINTVYMIPLESLRGAVQRLCDMAGIPADGEAA